MFSVQSTRSVSLLRAVYSSTLCRLLRLVSLCCCAQVWSGAVGNSLDRQTVQPV